MISVFDLCFRNALSIVLFNYCLDVGTWRPRQEGVDSILAGGLTVNEFLDFDMNLINTRNISIALSRQVKIYIKVYNRGSCYFILNILGL